MSELEIKHARVSVFFRLSQQLFRVFSSHFSVCTVTGQVGLVLWSYSPVLTTSPCCRAALTCSRATDRPVLSMKDFLRKGEGNTCLLETNIDSFLAHAVSLFHVSMSLQMSYFR
ncbi:hypothetical protein MC885_001192, partial [Smutsia gigantea]